MVAKNRLFPFFAQLHSCDLDIESGNFQATVEEKEKDLQSEGIFILTCG